MVDNISLESVKNILFGDDNDDNDLMLPPEGYEDVMDDENDDPSYYASQEGYLFGEAAGISTLTDISLSLEAENSGRIKAALDAIAQVFAKLALTLMNFVKRIEVYIKTIMLKEQKTFYDKNIKPNEAVIKASTVKVSVIMPQKMVGAISTSIKSTIKIKKMAIQGAFKKLETIPVTSDKEGVINDVRSYLEMGNDESPNLLNKLFYGVDKTPAAEEVLLTDLLKVIPLEYLGEVGIKMVKDLQATGMELAKDMDLHAKNISKLAKQLQKTEEGVSEFTKAASMIRSQSMIYVNLTLQSFTTMTRLMSIVRSGCKEALKAGVKTK